MTVERKLIWRGTVDTYFDVHRCRVMNLRLKRIQSRLLPVQVGTLISTNRH